MSTTTSIQFKERPILFSGPMVRAILDGRKTQTRRVVKLPMNRLKSDASIKMMPEGDALAEHWPRAEREMLNFGRCERVACPHGKPGDVLWVRETHMPDPPCDNTWDYYAYTDGVLFNLEAIPERFRTTEHVLYAATWTGGDMRWRPSIFMPRWACRIRLEIVKVRVERIQDITNEDAKAEGIAPNWCGDLIGWNEEEHGWWNYLAGEEDPPCYSPKESFKSLWESINADRGFGWDANPWVWVIEFRRIG